MKTTIFYSWQSDLSTFTNRNFIEKCIKKAIDEISKDDNFKLELNLERDTQGVTGTVDISATIFNKIDNCNVFIGDITLIHNINENKKTPNPNVLIELGYAAAKISWENVICVFNENYGKVEELPFDLRSRRPIIYNIHDDISPEEKEKLEKSFIKALKLALLSLDISKRNSINKVLKEFVNENDYAKKLATEHPEYWLEKLQTELLSSKLERINLKIEDMKKGLVFHKIKSCDGKNFIKIIRTSISDVENMVQVFSKALNEEYPEALKSSNNYDCAIKVKRAFDRMTSICNIAIEWEYELESLHPPDNLFRLKELNKGYYEVFSIPLNEMLQQISEIVNRIDHYKKERNNEPITIPVTLPNILGPKHEELISEYERALYNYRTF